MVQYTLAQAPEVILTVPGKDSAKARDKAMDQLMERMDAGELPTDLSEGFSPKQLVEVKEPSTMDTVSSDEDAITQAVQVLNNLATLKLKVQESRTEALEVRKAVDILFTDQSVSEEEISRLKEGFKVLKNFAQANLRYHEARAKAEQARTVIDQALKSSES
jgi:LPS O-antigen subunit length determinant protein (WzzB/FepE family)